MKLDLTTIPVNLTGTQSLQISGSPVGELHVTFPAGFQPKEIGARNASGLSVLNNWEKLSVTLLARPLIRVRHPHWFDLPLQRRLADTVV
jgi:hypothetical protein